MTLPRPTIVIFDMDGTAVRHINPRLLHLLERIDDVVFTFHRFWGMLFRRGDKALVYDPAMRDRDVKKRKLIAHRVMHKVRRKPVEQIVEPCPGIYAVLNLLKEHNIPMALVSNGLGKGYGHEILAKFDMQRYFAVTLFREDIRNSKPNPEAIMVALREMARPVGQDDILWYIGDRHKDVSAALTAQTHLACPVVPIAYGFNAAVAVVEKNIGAEHIVMSYYEMYEILYNLLIRDHRRV